MKKLLFLGACLVALASQPVKAQTAGPEVLVVRLNQIDGYALLTRPDGKTEEIKLNPFNNKKGLTESGIQIQQTFASLYQQGYALKSTFVAYTSITTLVFVKEK